MGCPGIPMSPNSRCEERGPRGPPPPGYDGLSAAGALCARSRRPRPALEQGWGGHREPQSSGLRVHPLCPTTFSSRATPPRVPFLPAGAFRPVTHHVPRCLSIWDPRPFRVVLTGPGLFMYLHATYVRGPLCNQQALMSQGSWQRESLPPRPGVYPSSLQHWPKHPAYPHLPMHPPF